MFGRKVRQVSLVARHLILMTIMRCQPKSAQDERTEGGEASPAVIIGVAGDSRAELVRAATTLAIIAIDYRTTTFKRSGKIV